MTDRAPLLEVHGLCKSYAAPVLRNLDLRLERGEIRALMGANGAGKSTLSRILAGFAEADGGVVRLDGQTHTPRSRREAEAAGVVMVHQELSLIPTLTVAENLFLDHLPTRWGVIHRAELHRWARQALDRLSLGQISPEAFVSELGIGERQLVEIAGALARDCRLLILDEPTACLTDPEIDKLFGLLRGLSSEGRSILYISHRMDEIRRVADTVTVMRDGECISTRPVSETSPARMLEEISGEAVTIHGHRGDEAPGDVLLTVNDLWCGPRVQGVSLCVRAGEIVGLAGLVGAGRTETLRAIYGAEQASGGTVQVGGSAAGRFREPSDAVCAGLGLVPEDRQHEGLLLSESIRVNTTLATLDRHQRTGWLDRHSEIRSAAAVCNRLDVKCASPEQPVSQLSGGNQQKVVLGRWLERGCKILLCDEPTRGVDARAKASIHRQLRQMASAGCGVLMVSSELEELMGVCDRIVVLSAGKVTGEFGPDDWSPARIHAAAFQNC